MSETSAYRVWFDPRHWGRIRDELQRMNTGFGNQNEVVLLPGYYLTGEPLPLPEELEEQKPAIDTEVSGGADQLVGCPAPSILATRHGWNLPRLSRYLAGNPVKQTAAAYPPEATWATLAAYLRTTVVVDDWRNDEATFWFIGLDGSYRKASAELNDDARPEEFTAKFEHARSELRATGTCGEAVTEFLSLLKPGTEHDGDAEHAPSQNSSDHFVGTVLDNFSRWGRVLSIARRASETGATGPVVVPYGTSLRVDDVVLADPADVIAGNPVAHVDSTHPTPHGTRPVRYTIELDPGLPSGSLTCRVDGVTQTYRDHRTGAVSTHGTGFVAWVAWILRHDAAAHTHTAEEAELGPEEQIRGALERAETNVVAYDAKEASTESFDDVAQLQSWIDTFYAQSPVKLRVHLLDAASYEFANDVPMLTEYHRFERAPDAPDPTVPAEVGYFGVAFRPWAGASSLLPGRSTGTNVPPIFLGASLDGDRVEQYEARLCLPFDQLEPHLAAFGTVPELPAWYVIHLVGTNTALVVPGRDAMVHLAHDGDGARVSVLVRNQPDRLGDLETAERFKAWWGRWFDDDVVLSDDEVAAAVTEIEARVTQALNEEDSR